MTKSDHAAPSQYLIIAGHGRSGSNRLLDAFDCHSETFCRNEPNRPDGSPFLELPDGFFSGQQDGFAERWMETIDQASRQISVRDRLTAEDKSFVRSQLRKAFARQVFLRLKPRRLVSALAPSLRTQTSPAVPFYAEPGSLDSVYPVFKILLTSGWIADAFHQDQRMKVILNIRAPKPFLRSWKHRYADPTGVERVFQENLESLPRILDHFGASAKMPAAFNERALYESELWRWRYVNELLLERLSGQARFTTVTYEDFEASPAAESARLYQFAGLEIDDKTRRKIEAMENTLFKPRPAKAHEDDGLLEDVIENVLPGSSVNAFWAQ